MKNKFLKLAVLMTLLFALALPLVACGNSNAIPDAKGGWGGISWVFTSSDKTLTITGSGTMPNAKNETEVDWAGVRSAVEKVVFVPKDGKTIENIGDYAFFGMSNLKNITLPNTISSIGNFAFTYCSSRKIITLPGESEVKVTVSVPKTDAEDKVVKDENGNIVMENVEKTETLSGVTSIGNSAFELCTSIQNITLPKNIKSIGTRAFALCNSLEHAKFEGTGVSTDAEGKETVMTIGDYTFFYCKKLMSVTVPTEFKPTFGENAFKEAKITADKIEKVEMKEEEKPTEAPSGSATEKPTEKPTDAPATEKPTDDTKSSNTSTIIALVVLGLCVVGICVGGVLLARSNKKQAEKGTTVRKNDTPKKK